MFPTVQDEKKTQVKLKAVTIDGLTMVYPDEAKDVIINNLELRARCNVWGCLVCAYHFHQHVSFVPDHIRSIVLPTDGYIIDIGCHIGTVTLPLAKVGFYVLAIDGSIESIKCLDQSMIKNNLNNVSAISAILSDGKYDCDFNVEANPYNAIQEGHTYQTTTLDSILDYVYNKNNGAQHPCALIKIDVEAYEHEVLRGAINTIKKHWPVLYIEINSSCLHKRGISPNKIFSYLDDLDYEVYIVHNPSPIKPHLRKIDIHNVFPFTVENVFALHKSYDKSRLRMPIGPIWDTTTNNELLEERTHKVTSDSPFYKYFQVCKK